MLKTITTGLAVLSLLSCSEQPNLEEYIKYKKRIKKYEEKAEKLKPYAMAEMIENQQIINGAFVEIVETGNRYNYSCDSITKEYQKLAIKYDTIIITQDSIIIGKPSVKKTSKKTLRVTIN